jgi:hypothetical protein
MARCKCCHLKGFTVETDANGLCSRCAPYYYLSLSSDLKALEQTLQALSRIDHAVPAMGRLDTARSCLERLRPYATAGLVRLPEPMDELDRLFDQLAKRWQED